jgi:hypothetical protein
MEFLLVAVVAFAIIYYIGREVIGALRHPSDEALEDFWAGRLEKGDRKAFRRVTEHLGSCESCRDRLDEIRKSRKPGPGSEAPLIERKY